MHNVDEKQILKLLNKEDTPEVLFHHRFPTSTENVRRACHPFSTKDYFENQYIIVHNGVIRNPFSVKKTHEDAGIEYVSKVNPEDQYSKYNDSEALVYDLAHVLEGKKKALDVYGTIAFIAIKLDGVTKKPMGVFFGRNTGNPLRMKLTKFSLTLSSLGEGDDVEPNFLYYYSYDTHQLTRRYLNIPLTGSYAGNYQGSTSRPAYTPNSTAAKAKEEEDIDQAEKFITSQSSAWSKEEQRKQKESRAMREKFLREANWNKSVAISNLKVFAVNISTTNDKLENEMQQIIEEDEELYSQKLNEWMDNTEMMENALKAIEDLEQLGGTANSGFPATQQPIGFRAIETGRTHRIPENTQGKLDIT